MAEVKSYEKWASVEVDMGADLAAIARAAGSACAEGTIIWSEGRGYVADVKQDALSKAQTEFTPAVAKKLELTSYASNKRREIEIGGIEIGGVRIATDPDSQTKIIGAYVSASRNPDWTTMWDSVHPIDAATMIQIGEAVEAHINASFVKRGEVYAAIEAGTIKTTAQIDAAFNT